MVIKAPLPEGNVRRFPDPPPQPWPEPLALGRAVPVPPGVGAGAEPRRRGVVQAARGWARLQGPRGPAAQNRSSAPRTRRVTRPAAKPGGARGSVPPALLKPCRPKSQPGPRARQLGGSPPARPGCPTHEGAWPPAHARLLPGRAGPGEAPPAAPPPPRRPGTAARRQPGGPGGAGCWEGRAPAALLETGRIRFQINENWVRAFMFPLPALMLF